MDWRWTEGPRYEAKSMLVMRWWNHVLLKCVIPWALWGNWGFCTSVLDLFSCIVIHLHACVIVSVRSNVLPNVAQQCWPGNKPVHHLWNHPLCVVPAVHIVALIDRLASVDSAMSAVHVYSHLLCMHVRRRLARRLCSVKHYVQPLYNDIEWTDGHTMTTTTIHNLCIAVPLMWGSLRLTLIIVTV